MKRSQAIWAGGCRIFRLPDCVHCHGCRERKILHVKLVVDFDVTKDGARFLGRFPFFNIRILFTKLV